MATAVISAPLGRPVNPDQEAIVLDICNRLALGQLAADACKLHNIQPSTLFRWCEQREDFRKAYVRAREAQAHALAEQAILMADGVDHEGQDRLREMVQSIEGVEDKDKAYLLNSLANNAIQRDKLRLDARKWYTSKIAPRLYGDRQAVELSGPDGGPIQQEWTFGVRKIGF